LEAAGNNILYHKTSNRRNFFNIFSVLSFEIWVKEDALIENAMSLAIEETLQGKHCSMALHRALKETMKRC
jgi:hypothetical protein